MGLTEKSFLERNEEMGIFKTDCNVKSNQSGDLISRAAVLARFKALQEYDPEHEGRGWACNFLNDSREPSTEWYCVEDVVEDMPAVDAVPVVHGRWVKMTGMMPPEYHGHYECSECQWHMKGLRNSWTREEELDYCPHCGAKMDIT